MFSQLLEKYSFKEIKGIIYSTTEGDVKRALQKERLTVEDAAALLSPAAAPFIEQMAVRASQMTLERFGKTIKLYAPLYLSNECGNACLYCGFSSENKIVRRTLTEKEIRQELDVIYSTGIRHILLVSGEAPAKVSIDYLCNAIKICKERFPFVGIEIYPASTEDYIKLVDAGADNLVVYQETYNKETYAHVHPKGRKSNMEWRLDTPDRGAVAGVRVIGIAALMGLDEPRTDTFFTILHADYLIKKYWRTHITVSLPRMRAAEGCKVTVVDVDDKLFVQMMLAMRLILPDAGIVVSTRERGSFRENLIGLGVTQMSAGSATEPGGYAEKNLSGNQFIIDDDRSVDDFCKMLRSKGYEPVMKDWQ